jgi:hypothetical protein
MERYYETNPNAANRYLLWLATELFMEALSKSSGLPASSFRSAVTEAVATVRRSGSAPEPK